MTDRDGLLSQLRDFWLSRRREVDQKWDRTTPFGDYVVDRWERAQELDWGKGASVYDSCLILGDVKVGEGTWVGPFTVLDGSGGLTIGANCNISAGAQIYSHESVARVLSGGEKPITRAATSIGSNVYIGPNVVVTMGVTIGDGAAIGANSLVLHDVPAGAKAYGNPARISASSS